MGVKQNEKRKLLSFLLAVVLLLSTASFSPVTAGAANGTVEVSTWDEMKRALEYTTNCSVVKVVKDIETESLNGHTGLHQNNIIFMTMAMDKVLDLNGHTVNAYVKYYSEVGQGYLINIRHKDARLTIRDSVGGGALIGEFNQEFYYQFINVDGGTLVMESGTVKMLCPSADNQYKKCAISVSGTAIFNGGEVLTQVTSPGGEREERYLSRRLQAIQAEKGGSVTINGGTFDRVVLHSTPTPENRGKYELVVNGGFFRQSIAQILVGDVYASHLDHLTIRVYLKDGYEGYKFDKKNPPKIKIRGLNRECDSISVSVASDERSLGVSLASHPSELIQSAWGTVTGLRAGSLVGGVEIRPNDNSFELQIKEIQRVKNGVAYSTSPNDVIDPDYNYRIKVVGVGKRDMTFSNGPEQYDYTFHYYLNTNVKLRMNNDFNTAADYKERYLRWTLTK